MSGPTLYVTRCPSCNRRVRLARTAHGILATYDATSPILHSKVCRPSRVERPKDTDPTMEQPKQLVFADE